MDKKNQKQNFYLSVGALLCLLLSLIVFYPLSMEVDRYSNIALAIWAVSFYIFQGISFTLSFVALVRIVILKKPKKEYLTLFSLIITALVFATFGYEVYWLLSHI